MQKLKTLLLSLLLLVGVQSGHGQKLVSLRDQAKNIDFGAASSTRPMKTGSALPASCLPGEMFFLVEATPGQNLYGCTSAGVWTRQAGGTAGPSQPGASLTFSYSFNDQAVVSIPNEEHGLNSADLSVQCYDNGSPSLELARESTSIDPVSYEVTINFSAQRSGRCLLILPGRPYLPGPGLVQNGAEWRVDSVIVPAFLSGEAELTTWTLAAGECQQKTWDLLGAAVRDALSPRWPEGLPAGATGLMLVTAAGQVGVRLCNHTADVIEVPVLTFGASVIKGF